MSRVSCGERGIRTPGTLRYNGFQDRRIRPLCHFSEGKSTVFLVSPNIFKKISRTLLQAPDIQQKKIYQSQVYPYTVLATVIALAFQLLNLAHSTILYYSSGL